MRGRAKALFALSCLVAGLLVAGPSAAQGRHPCLAPSGDDDTAALQAALDRCSGAGGHCTVTLCPGTFQTGILRAWDFRGTLRGAGSETTVLRALPDLPVSDDPRDFFRQDPADPARPWPYLVQFFEGTARIESLGILVPAPPAGSRPTTGWTMLDFGPTYALRGAILLTGKRPAGFEVRDVRVLAEDPGDDLGTTAFHGVEFGGLLHDPDDPGPFPVFPARGSCRITDSRFEGVLIGAEIAEITRARVTVARNLHRSTVAVDVIDSDRSQVSILANRWTASYRGVQVRQNLDGVPSRAGEILVDDNRGTLLPLFPDLGDGLFFQDPIDASPDPGATVLRATRNRLTVGSADGAAASGITTSGAARLRLAYNRLSGRAATGLDVDTTRGCLVFGNSLGGLETTGPDLRLGPGTSDCVAVVSRDDAVVDEGSANRVIRR